MLKPSKKHLPQDLFIDVRLPKFLAAKKQKTLKKSITFSGIGLHTGKKVSMTLSPAPPETGFVFRQKINDGLVIIEANYKNVKSTKLCTLLSDSSGNSVSTVEHVLSALYGLELDNVYIDLDSSEIPVCDGSSLEFVNKLKEGSFEEQNSYKKFIKIKKNIEVIDGNKIARVSPFDNTLITTEVEYKHKLIGKQSISLILNPEIYSSQICSARTFGFLKDVENLRKSGLGLGGNLDNAIVLDDEKVLNKEGLRFSDEFVRHKALDFIGDISLAGYKILGSFFTSHTGHNLNYRLIKKIFDSPDSWELVCSN
ncbi:MAG: UDP-3-O-acyl-N-acetylglucosamine deacetylase [Pseudomonadota bacterium]|nr:UDP-3-O-acyl-N-acetylglucosamine deacetylase [Pseudomonadota bacterium]